MISGAPISGNPISGLPVPENAGPIPYARPEDFRPDTRPIDVRFPDERRQFPWGALPPWIPFRAFEDLQTLKARLEDPPRPYPPGLWPFVTPWEPYPRRDVDLPPVPPIPDVHLVATAALFAPAPPTPAPWFPTSTRATDAQPHPAPPDVVNRLDPKLIPTTPGFIWNPMAKKGEDAPKPPPIADVHNTTIGVFGPYVPPAAFVWEPIQKPDVRIIPPPIPDVVNRISPALLPTVPGYIFAPLGRKGEDAKPPPTPPDVHNLSIGALFGRYNPPPPWFPYAIKDRPLIVDPNVVKVMIESDRRNRVPAAIIPAPGPAPSGFIPSPTLVPTDPAAELRTRQHLQIVAQMLNSLITSDGLVEDVNLNWYLGYTVGFGPNWSGTAPTTVAQALDRIAAAIKALTGSGP